MWRLGASRSVLERPGTCFYLFEALKRYACAVKHVYANYVFLLGHFLESLAKFHYLYVMFIAFSVICNDGHRFV